MTGKQVTGILVSNCVDSELDRLELTFNDGSKLTLSNEYIEGFGWTKINMKYEKSEGHK